MASSEPTVIVFFEMNRKVIIYGGSGGIGFATARLLKEKGYSLHLVARDADKLKGVSEDLGATFTVGDVEDGETFPRVAEEVGESVDGLVYAVGTINLASIQRLNEEQFIKDFKVNAVGAALAVQSVLPALKNGAASSVVFYSSVVVQQGFKFHASMGMAKGAVEGLTLSLAAECAPKVRVNAIAPSLTDTPLAAGILSNERTAEAIAGMHPLPRIGSPEDIASLTAFLISDEADWITGQVFNVDGGRSTVRVGS